MKRNILLFSILGVALVAVGVTVYFLTKPSTTTTTTTSNSNTEPSSNQSKYATLKGEEFDETYLADMLAHHEGAVTMSENSAAQTNRAEILALSQSILQSQGEEMVQMLEWQEKWGYEKTMGGHASHSGSTANEMAGHMMDMTDQLEGLKDEAYDEKFISLMIEHHQQAMDKSKYASSNAYHPEIKELASNVIKAQEAEIAQMKQWRMSWGFEN